MIENVFGENVFLTNLSNSPSGSRKNTLQEARAFYSKKHLKIASET